RSRPARAHAHARLRARRCGAGNPHPGGRSARRAEHPFLPPACAERLTRSRNVPAPGALTRSPAPSRVGRSKGGFMVRRLLIAAAVALSAPALAATWQIDPAHSNVSFSVRHMMVSNVRGEFTKVSGTVEGDEKAPTQAVINATIDASSINTREEKRDTHLKSADFLDVAKDPTITFKSKKIEPSGTGQFKVTG